MRVWGRSSKNFMELSTSNYRVKTTLKYGKLHTTWKKQSSNLLFDIYLIINILLVCIFAQIIINLGITVLIWGVILLFTALPVAFSLFLKKTTISKIHAIEHKICNYAEEHDINRLLTIDEIKTSSRISAYCGGNQLVYLYVIIALLMVVSAITPFPWWLSCIILITAYWLYSKDYAFFKRLIKPIYWLGAWYQKNYTTRETDEVIYYDLGLATINKLIDLENKRQTQKES